MFLILNVANENYDRRKIVSSKYCFVNMQKLSPTFTILDIVRIFDC